MGVCLWSSYIVEEEVGTAAFAVHYGRQVGICPVDIGWAMWP